MNKILKHIPNTITCLNLLSGCLACINAFNGNFIGAAYCIYMAAIFDFFDGFAARLLKAYSPIGKELDSLADCISFGFAPGIILFSWMSNITFPEILGMDKYLPFTAFLIPVFSALRLAKFNIDERQTSSFIGLPTPACSIFMASLSVQNVQKPDVISNQGIVLVLITIFFAFLLVAEFPMFALKFKHYGLKGNEIRYAFIVLAGILLFIYGTACFHWIILLYIATSAIVLLFKKRGKLHEA